MRSSHCLAFPPPTPFKKLLLKDLEELKILIDTSMVQKIKFYEMMCIIRRNSKKTKRLRLTEFPDYIG